MSFDLFTADATAIATAVHSGQISARTVVRATLDRIRQLDPQYNSFTTVTETTALADADRIDRHLAEGEDPGVLAGVPFAVKNLLDIAGVTTLAGSKILAENPPASQDASTVKALRQAGAILIGALNMDEFAYGFTTENAHYGATRNPHDLERMSGGSSGGSAAAVAAGLVPLTLGSDTNGSIRVPAALCGIFGLKPTYGRVSRAGSVLFSASFDHIGPFARSVRDLAQVFDLLQGADPADPVCTSRPVELCLPQLDQGLAGLRLGIAEGYFAQGAEPEVMVAVETVATALGISQRMTIPEAHRARAAAFVITSAEGANQHFERLRIRPQDFDPATRDRFLAGTMVPAQWVLQAQRFRTWYREQVRQLFETVDVLIAPTTPCSAPLIGQEKMMIGGQEVLTRPNLGLYTQPLSFIGLPVISVPIQRPGSLPLGVQLIAAPYQEARILRVAAALESMGIVSAPVVNS